VTYKGTSYTDFCLDSKVALKYKCGMTIGTKTVAGVGNETVTCLNACADGACVKKSGETKSCLDPTPGNDFSKKDYVTFNGSNWFDLCITPDRVREYYCSGADLASIAHACTCEDGACLQNHCTNKRMDQDETGVDCGGACLACECTADADCSEPEKCVSGQCKTFTCGDEVCDDHLGETQASCPDDCGACTAANVDDTRCGSKNKLYQCATGQFGDYTWKHVNTCKRYCDPATGECIDDEVTSCKKVGGKDFYEAGTAVITKNDSTTVQEADRCSDEDTLIEPYCNGKKLLSTAKACKWGCADGACLKVKQFICRDTVTSEWHSGACTSCPTGYTLRACEQKKTLLIIKKSREVCHMTQNSECATRPKCQTGWEKIDTIECTVPPELPEDDEAGQTNPGGANTAQDNPEGIGPETG
jgi:hypothetical protein